MYTEKIKNLSVFNMKRIIYFILITLILYVNTVFSEEKEIKIGLSLSLTGRYREMAEMQYLGFLLWEEEVNRKGGVLGRKIKLLIQDDRSDPETAKGIYHSLINKEKVDLLFSPYSSEITEAVIPVIEKEGYPLIASGASSDRLWRKGYKNIFGLYTTAGNYTAGFLELLLLKDIKKIAIIHTDDAFSLELASGTKKRAERLGLEIVLYEGFHKGEEIPEYIIKKLKDLRPDGIILGGHFEEAINMLKIFKKIKWYPKAYFASVGPALERFYKIAGKDAEGVFSASQWEPENGMPGSLEFYNAFVKRFSKEPSYHAATAYAAGMLLEEALKRTGSFDRSKIREVLSLMDIFTILGRYNVDASGKQIKHYNLVIQWQKGKKKIVWPEEVAKAKPIFWRKD